ncbi:bifunctional 4-hydroxy-2-oxoglutarate aldolase/2-dehydro-3-deoxy-phosphogluconate aldolase [Pontibacillus yanchengensis]|uniref:Bifunctional 4-hydroxy-2-oxoglutarate aldolase/2-dehydro-3-deoxy-phosphogluconate aldolase n=2 Tax=Pontibacillus yanchengensis TaxID=462910 RepID=A0ACC7VEH5_9BACI|nr:bifunctional 2-keto-4-hydroxyglutarate aldolase/2-keto-3-deoxy-6-phosphogluconate aldolase [Pontibacillus yanchengensis]MYL32017.1 bifunctional 4-hydroxy-2-oxoglutarate aldolase/2-dehydro-3-deoxy-phosphogluconate aldolase [Pontibacillus yanchengensis]MYL52594.1 bifunctional 4-hydroxy-2-oxoglutarate aldolase/2-dehydro-3-deoxy-phosphogluconate aldolase [Pontibacillus yanchengensis]
MKIVERLQHEKIVAVLRNTNVENIVPIVHSLREGGVKVVEITAETPHASSVIQKLVEHASDDILVGAGTVLDSETARLMIMAGAQFIVSPTVNEETIRMTKRYGIPSIPGALTPTEIITAYENGADVVKVFPANVSGPEYIKALKGPLPHIPLMVTGGIHEENINQYLSAGAEMVGVGGQLVKPDKLNTDEDFYRVTEVAKRFVSEYTL